MTEEINMSQSPQDQLLEALLSRDINTFCTLLNRDDVDPNYKYEKPHYSTCLEIACRKIGCEEFVRVLLKRVKPNNNHIYPEPIHFAAKKGNDGALKVLLEDKRTIVNAVDSSGRTALHHAVKEFGKGEGEDSMTRSEICVGLLIKHPEIDINRTNNKGITAIFEAAHYGGKEAVEAMLMHCKKNRKFVDLDGVRGIGKTPRSIILEKFPELKDVLPAPVLPPP